MAFTDTFIKRPVLALCVNLLILVVGIQSIRSLNVRQYPKSDSAVVKVTTAYIGANADLVRGFVTTPLERVIASADGIDYLESQSTQGLSTISAYLKLNYNTNDALTQIQAKIAQVKNDLPKESEASVVDVQTTDNRFASVYLSFYSDSLKQNEITDYLTRVVQPRLSAVSGVQKADILGARTFAMRVWLRPEKMAALGISPSEIGRALSENNYLSALGATKGRNTFVNLLANTDLKSTEEFKELVVRQSGTNVVRLRDVADVELGAENYDTDVRFGGQTATFMGIWVLPQANSLEVIQEVRKVLPDIERELPSGMKLGIPYDATKYIQNAIHEVIHTLIETVGIVIVVIFLFLGSFRSVLVPVVAIPLSLVGGAGLMLAFGFTINLLTLLAIVLAVGLVVDDAIVMLENIERHVEEGMPPFDAAIKGARELVGPTIAMTITLATVYAPIGFQGGLTGALFREFAFTLAGAVTISGIVALTLSPMMSSYLVREKGHPTRLQGIVNGLFDKVRETYKRTLAASISVSPAVNVVAAIFIVIAAPLYMFSMKELAPKEDQGVVFGIVQASPNNSLDQTIQYAEEVGKIFRSVPEYENAFQLTNPSGGFSGIVTKPWSERTRTTEEIQNELFGRISTIPGLRVIVTTPPPLPGGSDFPVELVISTVAEPERLYDVAYKLVGKAFQSGMFMFADADLKFDQPQTRIELDRNKIAMMGLNLQQVGSDLGFLLGGNYVNRFSIQGRSYKVIPQVRRDARLTPEQILQYYVSGPVVQQNDTRTSVSSDTIPDAMKGRLSRELVPVGTFATLKNSVEPRSLNRFQQLNSVKIQGVIPPGVAIDQALSTLETEAKSILPQGFSIDYAGESRQLRKEGNALLTTLTLAIILIFLVLAAQFESLRDPFIVLLGSVPLALSGALIFPFLGATTINIYSQVGLITLVGLIAKNGILIVEFANKLQEQGLSKLAAVQEAAVTRLRPILMTTVATVVGHFPLVLATGAGAGSRNSIGIVLCSGMTIGTFFTLFVVPSIYLLIAKDHGASGVEEPSTPLQGKKDRQPEGHYEVQKNRALV